MTASPRDNAWRRRQFAPAPGTNVCRLGEIADSGAREFHFGEGRETFRLLVLRRGEIVRGYVNFCPHFSLPLNSEPDRFLLFGGRLYCANHTAAFRIEDGYCEDGPCAGDWLERVPLTLEQGVVKIGMDQ
jgi:nitrite reductase/ring-hydroxylating ferredoxin subunit